MVAIKFGMWRWGRSGGASGLLTVKRTDTQIKGFVVLPIRWVVEHRFGWINRARRLAKDFEVTIESSLAWLLSALAFLLIRRLARLNPKPA